MTDADINQLRDLLRAATPGPLTVMARNAGEQCVAVVNQLELVPPNGVELAHEKADADFLAAAVNALPGLLDEVERLRADVHSANERASEWSEIAGEHGAEVDRMRRLMTDAAAAIEKGMLDAERYRWLRDPANAYADEWNLFGPYSSPKEIDAAIDAAMGGEKRE